METVKDRSNRSAQAEVLVPSDQADLSLILSDCHKTRSNLTILGGRTSLTGSCVPGAKEMCVNLGSWISISEDLNYEGSYIQARKGAKSLTWLLNKKEQKAIFGAGVLIEDLDSIIGAHGFLYLPTPGYKKCTLGGTVSTNASGPRTFSFGTTRDHVWFARIMLACGDIVDIERNKYVSFGNDFSIKTKSGKILSIPVPKYEWRDIKNASGVYNKLPLDLLDLFIGSEGLLGIVLDIGINLKRFESDIVSEILFWEKPEEALKYGFELSQKRFDGDSGMISVEYMDQNALQFGNDKSYKEMGGAIEIEYLKNDKRSVNIINQMKNSCNGILTGDMVAKFRYSIPYNVSEYLRKEEIVKIGTDFGVPISELAPMFYAYKEVQREFAEFFSPEVISSALWGHFGNAHLHLNLFPQTKDQINFSQKKYKELAEKAVSLGGVVSAEHGVGKKRFSDGTYLLDVQNEEMIAEITKTKKALDPHMILNRGNMGVGGGR